MSRTEFYIFEQFKIFTMWLTWMLACFLLMCMNECFACMDVCAPQCLWRPEKGLNPLELEFQMAVSCRVGTWELTLFLWKSSQPS